MVINLRNISENGFTQQRELTLAASKPYSVVSTRVRSGRIPQFSAANGLDLDEAYGAAAMS
jgi:hypothetical protein